MSDFAFQHHLEDEKERMAGLVLKRRRPVPVELHPYCRQCGAEVRHYINGLGSISAVGRCGHYQGIALRPSGAFYGTGYLTSNEEWRYGYARVTVDRLDDGVFYFSCWIDPAE